MQDVSMDIESLTRKWLNDPNTPAEDLDILEAVKKGQAFTDGETLARPLSLAEVVAMVMKVADTNAQFVTSMALSAIARAEGWDDDNEKMAEQHVAAWAGLDLLRIEVVCEILQQRGPLPILESDDPPSPEED